MHAMFTQAKCHSEILYLPRWGRSLIRYGPMGGFATEAVSGMWKVRSAIAASAALMLSAAWSRP